MPIDDIEKEIRKLFAEQYRSGAKRICKNLRKITYKIQNDIVAETIVEIVKEN